MNLSNIRVRRILLHYENEHLVGISMKDFTFNCLSEICCGDYAAAKAIR